MNIENILSIVVLVVAGCGGGSGQPSANQMAACNVGHLTGVCPGIEGDPTVTKNPY